MKSYFAFMGRLAMVILLMTTAANLYEEGLIKTSISVTILAIVFYFIALVKYDPIAD